MSGFKKLSLIGLFIVAVGMGGAIWSYTASGQACDAACRAAQESQRNQGNSADKSPSRPNVERFEWVNTTTIKETASGRLFKKNSAGEFVSSAEVYSGTVKLINVSDTHFTPVVVASCTTVQRGGPQTSRGEKSCTYKNGPQTAISRPDSACGNGKIYDNGKCIDTKTQEDWLRENLTQRNMHSFAKTAFADYRKENCRTTSCSEEEFINGTFTSTLRKCLNTHRSGSSIDTNKTAECLVSAFPLLAEKKNIISDTLRDRRIGSVLESTSSDPPQIPQCTAPLVLNKDQTDCVAGEEAEREGLYACALEGGLGWVICPMINLVAGLNDAGFSVISTQLSIRPKLLDTTSGTYQAWEQFRNIANVVFVIIFLAIIFSQITGLGLTNYGIKRMIPRLIIGAVLVNLSYFIAQFAVDVSNAVGFSIRQMFDELGSQIQAPGRTHTFTGFFGYILSGTGVVAVGLMAALAFGTPVLVATFLAIAIAVTILLARQSLVILLVAISPLAFAAWLLPNTESLFKKWQKLLVALLVLFPIISLLYGAGSLASNVLAAVATTSPDDPDELLHIAALGAAIIPLGATPFVLQGALKSFGALGTVLGGLSRAANKRVASSVTNDSRLGKMLAYRRKERAKNRALVQAGAYRGKGKIKHLSSSINSFINQRTPGRFGGRLAAQGVALAAQEDKGLVDEAATLMRANIDPSNIQGHASRALAEAVSSGDTIKARAAQSILLNSGAPGIKTLHDTIHVMEEKGMIKWSDETAQALRKDLSDAGIKGKDAVLNAWSYTPSTISGLENSASTFSGLTPVEMSGQHVENIDRAIATGALWAPQARHIIQSQDARDKLSSQKRALVDDILSYSRQTNPQGPSPQADAQSRITTHVRDHSVPNTP